MKFSLKYIVMLEKVNGGDVSATVPSLPEVNAYGENRKEALRNVRGAIKEAIANRVVTTDPIPTSMGRTYAARFNTITIHMEVKVGNAQRPPKSELGTIEDRPDGRYVKTQEGWLRLAD